MKTQELSKVQYLPHPFVGQAGVHPAQGLLEDLPVCHDLPPKSGLAHAATPQTCNRASIVTFHPPSNQ
jgi:hypothetical protein